MYRVLSVTTVTMQSIYAAISAYLIIGVAVYNALPVSPR